LYIIISLFLNTFYIFIFSNHPAVGYSRVTCLHITLGGSVDFLKIIFA